MHLFLMCHHPPEPLSDFSNCPYPIHSFPLNSFPTLLSLSTTKPHMYSLLNLKPADTNKVTMALARLALRNLQQRLSTSSSSLLGHNIGERSISGGVQRPRWSDEFMKRFLTTKASDEETEKKEVSVAEGDKKWRLFPKRKGRRGLWRNHEPDFPPALHGLGNALLQATENINRLFHNLNLSPSQLMGRVKEQDGCYKLRYEVPGLSKDDVKITIHDGVLTIKGEHKEEEEEGSDDESWSARSYGYYSTTLVLPDDAKVDDIKAELKDGVLAITIPRTEKPKKDVKEVKID